MTIYKSVKTVSDITRKSLEGFVDKYYNEMFANLTGALSNRSNLDSKSVGKHIDQEITNKMNEIKLDSQRSLLPMVQSYYENLIKQATKSSQKLPNKEIELTQRSDNGSLKQLVENHYGSLIKIALDSSNLLTDRLSFEGFQNYKTSFKNIVDVDAKSNNKTLASFVDQHYNGLIQDLDFSEINLQNVEFDTPRLNTSQINQEEIVESIKQGYSSKMINFAEDYYTDLLQNSIIKTKSHTDIKNNLQNEYKIESERILEHIKSQSTKSLRSVVNLAKEEIQNNFKEESDRNLKMWINNYYSDLSNKVNSKLNTEVEKIFESQIENKLNTIEKGSQASIISLAKNYYEGIVEKFAIVSTTCLDDFVREYSTKTIESIGKKSNDSLINFAKEYYDEVVVGVQVESEKLIHKYKIDIKNNESNLVSKIEGRLSQKNEDSNVYEEHRDLVDYHPEVKSSMKNTETYDKNTLSNLNVFTFNNSNTLPQTKTSDINPLGTDRFPELETDRTLNMENGNKNHNQSCTFDIHIKPIELDQKSLHSIKSVTSRDVSGFIANYYENLVTDIKSTSQRNLTNFATNYLTELIEKVKDNSLETIIDIKEDKKTEIIQGLLEKSNHSIKSLSKELLSRSVENVKEKSYNDIENLARTYNIELQESMSNESQKSSVKSMIIRKSIE